MSRFDQYRSESDLAPLRKLSQGEGFVAQLLGDHEFEGDTGAVPVLELKDDGGEFGWMAGGWHAREELALADPQKGDVIEVRRLADRGRSHQFSVRVVQAAPREQSPPQPSFDEKFGSEAPWE